MWWRKYPGQRQREAILENSQPFEGTQGYMRGGGNKGFKEDHHRNRFVTKERD